VSVVLFLCTLVTFNFPVSKMTYIVSSGTLNSTIPYQTYNFLCNWQQLPAGLCLDLLWKLTVF